MPSNHPESLNSAVRDPKGADASSNVFSEVLSWSEKNILNPALNAGALEPYNAVANLVNEAHSAASEALGGEAKEPLLNLKEHREVGKAEFLTATWLTQSVSSGLGALVPYVVAGKIAGSTMRSTGMLADVQGGAAAFAKNERIAQIVGAAAYDGMRMPAEGETRLGNALAGGAAFGVFEAGSLLSKNMNIVGRLTTRAGTGSIGGLTQATVSSYVATGELPDQKRAYEAAVGGAVMNIALPATQKAITKSIDLVNVGIGRGIPIDRFVDNYLGAKTLEQSNTLKTFVDVNPWVRVQPGAEASMAQGNRKVFLANGEATAAKLGHELFHVSANKTNVTQPGFNLVTEQLKRGMVVDAWNTFKEVRAGEEVLARVTEERINAQIAGREVNPGLKDHLNANLAQMEAKPGLTYEQQWRKEFQDFRDSDGLIRPKQSYSGPEKKGEGPDGKTEVPKTQEELRRESEHEKALGTSLIKDLQGDKHTAVFAGGSVRDEIMGRIPKDYDIATSAPPEVVERLFINKGYRVIPTGKQFGVINVIIDGREFEIATLRTDGKYVDGRRPDSVTFVSSLVEDAARRDLTINAMFKDPVTGTVYDFFDGQGDLSRRIIKAVGNPHERFEEDKLRMMRVPRFASKYDGFTVDKDTLAAIKYHAEKMNAVSAERIKTELEGILTGTLPVRGMQIMMNSGLMKVVLPEVYRLRGPKGRQDPYWHPEKTTWTHSKMVMTQLQGSGFIRMMGGLLHDVGKPDTQVIHADGGISNHGHDAVGAEMVKAIGQRLKMSNKEIDRVSELVRLHMQMHKVTELRQGKLIALLERPDIMDLIELQHADATGTYRPERMESSQRSFLLAKLEELKQAKALHVQQIVTGDMLIDMGFKPGPDFRKLKEAAQDAQREGQFNTQEGGRRWIAENKDEILR